ncbi:MAG: putative enoyl-CoA hydratase [Acidimicrobiia bacterium]|nr:putative enoyl-CoA hydratase [Acidimicrobiia bacterium]
MILTEQRDSLLLVTIDRPERRNAVDAASVQALTQLFLTIDPTQTKALVLTGAGSLFCAGADLTGVDENQFRHDVTAMLMALSSLPIVTIAAVNGAALGAGTQLAIACDLRVADDRARFGISAARLSLVVDPWTVARLALLAGHSTARAMLLAADTVDADAAVSIGLAQRRGDLAAALAWGAEISQLAPLSIAGHKLMLDELAALAPPSAAAMAAIATAWESADAVEGRTAFLEKRPAQFRGF